MKEIVLACLFAVCVSIFIPAAEAGQEINGCPLPDNMKIIAPDSNAVPPKLALLSGVWEGNWRSSVIFVVEQIKANEAVVIHAWSEIRARTQAGQSIAPGFLRMKCPVEQGEDGNYLITCKLKSGMNKLVQTSDPKQIRVVREGFVMSAQEAKETIFRKKEM